MTDPDPPAHRRDDRDGLPLWVRAPIIILLAVTAVVHLMVDVYKDDYEGAGTTYLLFILVGSALGINEVLKGRGS